MKKVRPEEKGGVSEEGKKQAKTETAQPAAPAKKRGRPRKQGAVPIQAEAEPKNDEPAPENEVGEQ